MERWLDRIRIKEKLQEWLNSEGSIFVLSVLDDLEFENVSSWLEDTGQDMGMSVGIAFFTSDAIVSEYELFESLLQDFGRDNFPNFKKLLSEIKKTSNKWEINMDLASNIQGEIVEICNNSQRVEINDNSYKTNLIDKFNSHRNELLDEFLKDLAIFSQDRSLLIICRFGVEGYEEVSNNFKSWFQRQFLRKTIEINDAIKICILCEKDSGNLNHDSFVSSHDKVELINCEDCIGVSQDDFGENEFKAVCYGILGDMDSVDYKYFKTKLEGATKRKRASK